ncbi:MAG TPA: M56 family metallopeptidase, partial [Lacipirellulaceae bacterium]|nr:M56 family metallopeptidase [Lacipirellulaceae bacterium]
MNAWLLTGWTMLHFLWIGTLVAAAGAVVRLACRRASPNLRYAASLATLLAVACTPFVIACLLASNPTPVPAAWEPPAPPVDGPMTSRTASDRVADVGDAVEVDHEGVPRRSRGLSGNGETFFELNTQGDGGVSRSELPGDLATTNSQAGDTAVGESRGAAVAAAAEQTAGAETPGLRQGLTAELIQRIVGMLPFVWIAGAPITFLLLAAGLVGSRRLTRRGTPLVQGPAAEACTQLRTALGVTRRVAVAAVEGLAQPVLVGIIKPTILRPAAALNGWTVAELEMVLVHELAHVRRWDNAVNLAQRLVESLLFFHPCV